jgi:UDP-N-acetylglucosamine 2-epimerase
LFAELNGVTGDFVNIFHIVGARPNFMKVAPVLSAVQARDNVAQTLVHTGQHYDVNMSDVLFQKLGNRKIFHLDSTLQLTDNSSTV